MKISVGKRYGELVVVRRAEYARRTARWVVICDCGVEKIAYAQSLQNSMRDCGCVPKVLPEFTVGQTFGKLTILCRDSTKAYTAWACLCECGKSVVRAAASLKNGASDCGCVARGHFGKSPPTPLAGARLIELSSGRFATVDECDANAVAQFCWSLSAGRYAYNRAVGLMHRFLMSPRHDQEVDHINGDGLDNRRDNLRVCSHRQNSCNVTSSSNQKRGGFKGVTFRSDTGKWLAKISFYGGQSRRQQCASPEEAALVYDSWARELFGEFAACNFSAPRQDKRSA